MTEALICAFKTFYASLSSELWQLMNIKIAVVAVKYKTNLSLFTATLNTRLDYKLQNHQGAPFFYTQGTVSEKKKKKN